MQLRFVRISVSDQEKALSFYTGKLGFTKMADIMMGDQRFLTVSAPDAKNGVQLILESSEFPPTASYQKARHEAGIPSLSINTDDIRSDYAKLKGNGVVFKGEPEDFGPIICASFDDECGNLVYLIQAKPRHCRQV